MILIGATMNELKTIKVSEKAHRGLTLAKAMDGIAMSTWASTVILEALEKDCPRAYKELRTEVIKEDTNQEGN